MALSDLHSDPLIYWASKPAKELGPELVAKKESFYKHLEETGHWSLLQFAHRTYYKSSYVKGRLRRTGENLEYIEIFANHYRNLLQHQLSLVVGQRPAFEPKAANTDYESIVATQLAIGLLDYYLRFKKLERFFKFATEHAINDGEAWIYCGWEPNAGEYLTKDPETNKPIYEGDVDIEAFTLVDVIREVTTPNHRRNWYMVRRYKNRHDLQAEHPNLADRLSKVEPVKYEDFRFSFRDLKEEPKDDIPVYCFMHKKTPALPEGRMCEWVDSDIILSDGPLPYRELPMYCIKPGEKEGSNFGYTNAWDLLPIQQAYDKLTSTILTNQGSFGVQNIGVPKGADLNVTQLQGGLNLIEFDSKAGPPVPINLTSTPAEIFQFRNELQSLMETLSAINSTVRGNPEQSLKSGSALALVQSMAIQFSQGLQQSYAQLLEDVGTAIINLLQDYASEKRVAIIAGKSNRSKLVSFKGDDLKLINRVLVDMGNPLMRTIAGRVNIAEQLVAAGQIHSPQEYLTVLTSGKLEALYEGDIAELNLVRNENEALLDNKPVIAIRTDDHPLHIQEHKALLSSPDVRFKADFVQTVLQHISEHESLLSPGAPTQANQGQAPGGVAPALDARSPTEQQAASTAMPQMPNMPKMPGPQG